MLRTLMYFMLLLLLLLLSRVLCTRRSPCMPYRALDCAMCNSPTRRSGYTLHTSKPKPDRQPQRLDIDYSTILLFCPFFYSSIISILPPGVFVLSCCLIFYKSHSFFRRGGMERAKPTQKRNITFKYKNISQSA